MEAAATNLTYPENISGIQMLRDEGAWKYIDVAAGVPRESLLNLLRKMPSSRELCFFEYKGADKIGDENGLYVMLQVYHNVCYFWKGSQGEATNLERMDMAEAADFILQNLEQSDAFLYLVPMTRRFEARTDFRWHDAPERAEDAQAELLRHLLATAAFRFQRAIELSGPNFGEFSPGHDVRTPNEITHHMRDVIAATHAKLADTPRETLKPESWEGEVVAFHKALEAMDDVLLRSAVNERLFKKLLQGPFSDVLTHIGQIAMLRRMFGSPVPGVSYFGSEIRTGNTSTNQG